MDVDVAEVGRDRPWMWLMGKGVELESGWG